MRRVRVRRMASSVLEKGRVPMRRVGHQAAKTTRAVHAFSEDVKEEEEEEVVAVVVEEEVVCRASLVLAASSSFSSSLPSSSCCRANWKTPTSCPTLKSHIITRGTYSKSSAGGTPPPPPCAPPPSSPPPPPPRRPPPNKYRSTIKGHPATSQGPTIERKAWCGCHSQGKL